MKNYVKRAVFVLAEIPRDQLKWNRDVNKKEDGGIQTVTLFKNNKTERTSEKGGGLDIVREEVRYPNSKGASESLGDLYWK